MGMTEQYSQTVEVTVSSKVKAWQWIGIASVLFSLGFLMLTIFLKWYFVFAFLVLLTIGIVHMHFYNATAKEYTYDFSTKRLVIVKKDLMGKQRRILSLLYEDVLDFGLMDGLADDSDIVACNATNEFGVYQIVYKEDEQTHRLLFLPDDYMTALLSEVLKKQVDCSSKICD